MKLPNAAGLRAGRRTVITSYSIHYTKLYDLRVVGAVRLDPGRALVEELGSQVGEQLEVLLELGGRHGAGRGLVVTREDEAGREVPILTGPAALAPASNCLPGRFAGCRI